MESKGEDAVTTKTVAERAGVSIGTLYQYFDSRDALLLALADLERQRLARQLQTFLGAAEGERGSEALPEFVRTLVRSFARRRGARRQFELITATAGQGRTPDSSFTDVVAAYLRRFDPDASPAVIEADAFVLTYALQGALRMAALRNSPLLKEPAFEEALRRIIRAFASPQVRSGGVSRAR